MPGIDGMKSFLLPNPLKPLGFTDVLPFYSFASGFVEGFLSDREIASRIWLPNGMKLMKRATRAGSLHAGELAGLFDREFFSKRKGHLKDASVSGLEARAWRYFPPRKLCDYFYATNREGRGLPMDRLFFDIDRGEGMGAEDARAVASLLSSFLRERLPDAGISSFTIFHLWTGRSFHVYALLEKPVAREFYDEYLSPEGKFSSWADEIGRELGIGVVWGHEKGRGRIVIDPSQTPSGKLDRAPFSLHMEFSGSPGKAEVDGISLPLKEGMIDERGITDNLSSIAIQEVVENIEKWASYLPGNR